MTPHASTCCSLRQLIRQALFCSSGSSNKHALRYYRRPLLPLQDVPCSERQRTRHAEVGQLQLSPAVQEQQLRNAVQVQVDCLSVLSCMDGMRTKQLLQHMFVHQSWYQTHGEQKQAEQAAWLGNTRPAPAASTAHRDAAPVGPLSAAAARRWPQLMRPVKRREAARSHFG